MPETLCVIGTDTDAGKTVITAALAKAGADAGKNVLVIKPVQTGCAVRPGGPHIWEFAAPDMDVCRAAAPTARTRALECFEPACSPHLAARRTGRVLSARVLADAVRREIAEADADLVLIEGAGGFFTPLSETETLADLLALLDFPVLLVVGNKLGAVNHALLTMEACKVKGIPLLGFAASEPLPPADAAEAALRRDNIHIIATLGGVPCLGDAGHCAGLDVAENVAGDSAEGEAASREAASRDKTAWATLAGRVRPVLDALFAPFDEDRGEREEEAVLGFDQAHIWHPYTSACAPQPATLAVKTRGTRIVLRDGRELVDGMASWWCAIHGYNHPALMAALRQQAAAMPHVMFGGLTHYPAVTLAEKLLEMAPRGLGHVFFADSGSVAVEVALKMALQYQMAAGNARKNRILAVRGGYHGDTLGAMSVCDPENGMHHLFAGVLPVQRFAPRPECRFDAPYDPASFMAFAAELAASADTVAAVILEPIVQGAGGMWFYHPGFVRDVKAACERHGCLLILDEIATGFGRTGKLFACEHAGVEPDILCLGKGLTGGVMTLAATLATSRVARGVSRNGGVLMHGPTFMANPLACAVAGASLALLETGAWRSDVARIEAALQQGLLPCANLAGVADARVLGAIGVLEMEAAVNMANLQRYFVERGVWLRPFGRLIYAMPPYMATDEETQTLTSAMRGAVETGAWR